MKTLYLVRHAKAISQESGVNDFKRSLSKKGINDAKAMSRRLREKGIIPDFLISSPADRALETAHIFAKQFDYPIHNILLRDEIYDEDAVIIREMLKTLNDAYLTVMLFGHEPALSDLARDFLQDTEFELRTAGVMGISFDISHWQDIAETFGNLLFFDFPVRVTPKVYKKARKEIAKEIRAAMEDILENIDGEASKHLGKIIEKTSKKLAKELAKVLQTSKVEDIAGITSRKRIDNLSAGEPEKPEKHLTEPAEDMKPETSGEPTPESGRKIAVKPETEKEPVDQEKEEPSKATTRKRTTSTRRKTRTRKVAKQKQNDAPQTETQDSTTTSPKRRTRRSKTTSTSEQVEGTS